MSRYNQLLTLIDQHKPKRLLEIGVWNGQNAIRMINQAKKYHSNVDYQGYDLFEDATADDDAREFNVKGHNQLRAVQAEIRAATGAEVLLVKGNTRETLSEGMTRDFAFIDGGHSVETIASDYDRLKDCKVIVLDDYYTSDGQGCPDTSKYGCNTLVASLSIPFDILPAKDSVKGGGYTQLVLIMPRAISRYNPEIHEEGVCQ